MAFLTKDCFPTNGLAYLSDKTLTHIQRLYRHETVLAQLGAQHCTAILSSYDITSSTTSMQVSKKLERLKSITNGALEILGRMKAEPSSSAMECLWGKIMGRTVWVVYEMVFCGRGFDDVEKEFKIVQEMLVNWSRHVTDVESLMSGVDIKAPRRIVSLGNSHKAPTVENEVEIEWRRGPAFGSTKNERCSRRDSIGSIAGSVLEETTNITTSTPRKHKDRVNSGEQADVIGILRSMRKS